MNWLENSEREDSDYQSLTPLLTFINFKINTHKSSIFDIHELTSKLSKDELRGLLGVEDESEFQILQEQQLEDMKNEIWTINQLQKGNSTAISRFSYFEI